MSEYFTKEEALEKLGKKIRTNHAFQNGVSIGDFGVVTGIYKAMDGYGLIVTWSTRSGKVEDKFRKREYFRSIEEVR